MTSYQRYQSKHLALHERNFPHRVIEDIWLWSDYSEEHALHANGYLVQTADGKSFMVDPPCAGPEVLDSFKPLPEPQFIIITNRDHERCAQPFREALRIPVYASKSDAPLMSLAIDRVLEDGDPIAGWQVIQLENQKSPGEIALYNVEKRILILGDALIGMPLHELSMLPDSEYVSKDAAREGLSRLLSLDVRVVLPCHGDPVMLNTSSMMKEAVVD